MNDRSIIEFVGLVLMVGMGMASGAMLNEESNRKLLVAKGFAEYRVDAATGETKFIIFEIKDGQLVKE